SRPTWPSRSPTTPTSSRRASCASTARPESCSNVTTSSAPCSSLRPVRRTREMDDSVQLILRKVIALGTAVMLVVTLAAIAVVKADHDKAKATNVASGNNANSSTDYGAGGGDQAQGGDQGTAAQGASGGGATGASGAG